MGGVGHLIGRDECRARGIDGLERLSVDPLPATVQLHVPLGHVVGPHVARDVCGGFVGGGETAGAAPHDDTEFGFPVRVRGTWREEDVVLGPDQGVGRLVEHDAFRRCSSADFPRMIQVVQPDAVDGMGAGNGWSDALVLDADAR